MGVCYKCNAPFPDENGAVVLDAVCGQCSSWLHCCGNCLYYDEYSQKKCREPRAAFIFDRLGQNKCEFFKVRRLLQEGEPSKKKLSPRAEQHMREENARDKLNRLFNS